MNESRVAYDTNILAYIQGYERSPDDVTKVKAARVLHGQLAERCTCVAPQQALGEFYSVISHSEGGREFARQQLLKFADEYEVVHADFTTFSAAVDLATEYKLQFWDALILATAERAGCSFLLSEDMQDGFAWRGVTVVDPFKEKRHRKLVRVLG